MQTELIILTIILLLAIVTFYEFSMKRTRESLEVYQKMNDMNEGNVKSLINLIENQNDAIDKYSQNMRDKARSSITVAVIYHQLLLDAGLTEEEIYSLSNQHEIGFDEEILQDIEDFIKEDQIPYAKVKNRKVEI